MRSARTFCLTALLLSASGCTSGLFSGGTAQELPPLEPGEARVLIYRSSTTGSPYVPEVLLNGERVGKLDQAGVIFRDVRPGSYAVTASRISNVVNFSVGAGDRKYVRFTSGLFEKHMHPEMVDPARGGSEAAGLRVIGQGQR